MKTAVDIYEEKSRDLIHLYLSGDIDGRELLTKYHNIYYDIKQMERGQIKKAWFDSTIQFDNSAEMAYKKSFEDYYQETYASNGCDECFRDYQDEAGSIQS